jgi:hypothetical protein
MSRSLYLWEADGQVYWQDLGSGVSRYWHERVRAFTQASPTNLTSEGAAYSLPFASPSRYGGVVSSIEQISGSVRASLVGRNLSASRFTMKLTCWKVILGSRDSF